jgi:hypothetical protein
MGLTPCISRDILPLSAIVRRTAELNVNVTAELQSLQNLGIRKQAGLANMKACGATESTDGAHHEVAFYYRDGHRLGLPRHCADLPQRNDPLAGYFNRLALFPRKC